MPLYYMLYILRMIVSHAKRIDFRTTHLTAYPTRWICTLDLDWCDVIHSFIRTFLILLFCFLLGTMSYC